MSNKLKELMARRDELKAAHEEYVELSHQIAALSTQKEKEDRSENQRRLINQTKLIQCTYPSMGVEGSNGSALFYDKETADQLVASLNYGADYFHSYLLDYTTPGKYKLVPEYTYDHDGDIVYTAIFSKEEE